MVHINKIQACFSAAQVLYTKHAKDEMESQEFGEIRVADVTDAVLNGKLIENYSEDEPYPSCLIFGQTRNNRPIHIVCAYSKESDIVIVITVYHPDPTRWIEFERRKP
jgi:hypothetical protein